MSVTCPVCGAIVYVGYATHICGNCGYDGTSGWNDLLVWLRAGWLPIARPSLIDHRSLTSHPGNVIHVKDCMNCGIDHLGPRCIKEMEIEGTDKE